MSDNVFGVTPVAEADQGEQPSPASVTEPQGATEPEPAPEPEPAAAPDPEPAPAVDVDDEDEADLLSPDPENQGFRIGRNRDGTPRVYKDIQSADRAFRRQQERARAAESRHREAEERLARAERLLEQFMRSHSQPQKQDEGSPASEPPPAPPKPKRLTDLVSSEEFNELVVEYGPDRAFAKLAELTEQRLDEALEELRAETRPLVRERQVADRTAQTFDGAAALKGQDGKPLYPEIANPDSPEALTVFEIWKRNLADPQLAPLAFTPQGVRIAVMEYRLNAASNGQPAPRPRVPAAASVTARRAADRSLQSMGTDSRASVRPGAGPVTSDEERIQAAMRAQRHPVFGVAVRAGN